MDAISTVFISVITSSTLIAILIFTIRKYIGEIISHEFKKRADAEAAIREKEREREKAFFENRLGIYPEIAEVTYRIRNAINQSVEANNAYECNAELPALTGHLTEFLYRYRFFLPDRLFGKLHDFKRVAQDCLMVIDVFTRDENLFNSEGFREVTAKLEEYGDVADSLYREVREELDSLGR